LGGLLKECVEAPDLEGYRRADPQQIVASVLTDIQRYALLDFVREDYLASYQGSRFVESMRYVRSYPTQLKAGPVQAATHDSNAGADHRRGAPAPAANPTSRLGVPNPTRRPSVGARLDAAYAQAITAAG
jgi:hypothetical protein